MYLLRFFFVSCFLKVLGWKKWGFWGGRPSIFGRHYGGFANFSLFQKISICINFVSIFAPILETFWPKLAPRWLQDGPKRHQKTTPEKEEENRTKKSQLGLQKGGGPSSSQDYPPPPSHSPLTFPKGNPPIKTSCAYRALSGIYICIPVETRGNRKVLHCVDVP